jgi:hypothetical protein
MSTETKKRLPIQVSPKGTAFFPKLSSPDEFKGKLTFNTGLILNHSDPGVDAFLDTIRKAHAAAYDTAVAEAETPRDKRRLKLSPDLPIRPCEDADGNEDPERVVVRFKRAAGGLTKKGEPWEFRLPIFTPTGKPFPASRRIGGGSTIRCAFTPVPYVIETGVCGVTLRLESVQVLDLVESGGALSFTGYGFEPEQGEDPFDETKTTTTDDDFARPTADEEDIPF